MNILVTICARGGSKGVPGKNIRPLHGRPLITHSIDMALAWPRTTNVVVSTDSVEIAAVAQAAGASVPFMRPAELASDTAGKLPVITHALKEAELHFGREYDVVLDLDPTSPLRTLEDIERGFATLSLGHRACFSAVKARKSPYFNMVERDDQGRIRLVKQLAQAPASRQAAPIVYELNASIYLYKREALLANPRTLWDCEPDLFEMPPESAFDIDEERDFIIVETLMTHFKRNAPGRDDENG